MKRYFITFRSITYAQRAEKMFVQHGISCNIRRTPRWMEERGCGYGVEVRMTELSKGLEMLNSAGIPYRKHYGLDRDGRIMEAEDGIS